MVFRFPRVADVLRKTDYFARTKRAIGRKTNNIFVAVREQRAITSRSNSRFLTRPQGGRFGMTLLRISRDACGALHGGEEVGFEGEDGDGEEGSGDGDDEADAGEFPEADFGFPGGLLKDDQVCDGADGRGVAGKRAGAGDGEPQKMRVAEGREHGSHEEHSGDVADEI